MSKVHLTYETAQAQRYSRLVVFSIEKNRGGPSLVDVEFEKDFEHFRFEPAGSFEHERLVDDVVLSD